MLHCLTDPRGCVLLQQGRSSTLGCIFSQRDRELCMHLQTLLSRCWRDCNPGHCFRCPS